jgi:hypothetical protein
MSHRFTILLSAILLAFCGACCFGQARPYVPPPMQVTHYGSSWTMLPVENGKMTFTDGSTKVILRLNPSISLEIAPVKGGPGIASSGSLWTVKTGDRVLTSEDFEGTPVETRGPVATIEIGDRRGLGISGILSIIQTDLHRLSLQLDLSATAKERVQVDFPTLQGMKSKTGDLSYCMPRRGSVISNIPIDLREPYSGRMPLQFMDAYGPDGGVYLLTADQSLTYRYFHLTKDNSGVAMQVEYPEQEIGPGTGFKSAAAIVGFHGGDWHTALEAYKAWVKTWYKPAAPRKDWFRQVFNFRQQFIQWDTSGGDRYFDKNTKKYFFAQGIAEDGKDFGGIDYLHLFDWGASGKWGRCGDYEPWDQLGGEDAFRQAVKQAQDSGVPVGLYIEGYLIDPQSRIAQAHGKDWEMLGADGKPLPFFAPSMNMCSAAVGWQDYLSSVYAGVSRKTGAMGYYCDEMGFAGPDHFCYASDHGHPVPQSPTGPQTELIRKVRAAIGPQAVLYTEETPCDVTTQYQDGSFTYAITSVSDAWSPSHVNLSRFALPDFKTFEIIACDEPIGKDITPVKQIFFNGEGIWLEGPADKWFTPEVLSFISKMHGVMRTYKDCFTSLAPVPLVPTGHKMVFANQFPGNRRILWTLFNANDSAVRGELLAVRHTSGAKYFDAWNNREIKPRVVKDIAYLDLELGPHDIGCVVKESHR